MRVARFALGLIVLSVIAFLRDACAVPPTGSVHEFPPAFDHHDITGFAAPQPMVLAAITEALSAGALPAVVGVEALQVTGPSDNRVDLVIVGDGFSAEDLPLFRSLAADHISRIFEITPFKEYRNLFNIYRVDVASPNTGIGRDPGDSSEASAPALGTSFGCFGTPRLLCTSEEMVRSAASVAPAADQILVIANTATYGGAGYFDSGVAVYSGFHPLAVEIALHEMGHSFALLADEYESEGAQPYAGSEVTFPNVSILAADRMLELRQKWFRWIGFSGGAGVAGPVGTFEGADFVSQGKYRPTQTSKMRRLGDPYNPPSVEAFISRFYRYVKPIEAVSPRFARVSRGRTLRVSTALSGTGEELKVEWRMGGTVVRRSSLRYKLPKTVGRSKVVTVEVGDRSKLVRDSQLLKRSLTGRHSWSIAGKR